MIHLCLLPTAYRLPLTAYCLLLTAYRLPPTAYCLLLMAKETVMATETTPTTQTTVDDIRESLREVYDPELGINIIDLGLVYDIGLENGVADITATLTSPGCPLGPEIITDVRRV